MSPLSHTFSCARTCSWIGLTCRCLMRINQGLLNSRWGFTLWHCDKGLMIGIHLCSIGHFPRTSGWEIKVYVFLSCLSTQYSRRYREMRRKTNNQGHSSYTTSTKMDSSPMMKCSKSLNQSTRWLVKWSNYQRMKIPQRRLVHLLSESGRVCRSRVKR